MGMAVLIAASSMVLAQQEPQRKSPTQPTAPDSKATTGINTGGAYKSTGGLRTNVSTVPNSGQPSTARPVPARPPGLAESINPEQRTQLMEANNAMQKETQPLYLKMRQIRVELDGLVSTNNYDESAIRAKAAELGKVEGDLAIIRAKHQKTIRGLLSTNQLNAIQGSASTNVRPRLNSVVERGQTNAAGQLPGAGARPIPGSPAPGAIK